MIGFPALSKLPVCSPEQFHKGIVFMITQGRIEKGFVEEVAFEEWVG